MGDTNQAELMEAIEVFKYRYGIKEPLDMFRLDEIIEELRNKKETKEKKKHGK